MVSNSFAQILYVTSYNENEVFRVSNGSNSTFGSGMTNPAGLAVDSAGNLFVSNYAGSSEGIWKVTPGGIASLFVNASRPYGLAFDSLGNLFSTHQGGAIRKHTPSGGSTLFAHNGAGITGGIAIDSADQIYVANYSAGSIQKISSNGTVSDFVTGVGLPVDIAVNASGVLFVSVTSNGTVLRITPAGIVTTEVAGLGQPQGLEFDSDGNLYISDSSGIIKRTPGGVSTQFWSGSTNGLGLALSAIPEPSTYALLALGALTIFSAMRRRRANS